MSFAFYLTVGTCALLVLSVAGFISIQALRMMVQEDEQVTPQ